MRGPSKSDLLKMQAGCRGADPSAVASGWRGSPAPPRAGVRHGGQPRWLLSGKSSRRRFSTALGLPVAIQMCNLKLFFADSPLQTPPGIAPHSHALKAPGISLSPFPWPFPPGLTLLLILCIEKMKEKGRGKIYGSLYTPSRKTYVPRAHKSSNSGLCLQEFNIHNAPIFILVLPMNITE